MMTFEEACKAVVEHCPNVYAQNYARVVIDGRLRQEASSLGYTWEEAKQSQVEYILGNMTGWRGDLAKQVRETLKLARVKNEQ